MPKRKISESVRYCSHCGSTMKIIKERQGDLWYHSETGEPIYGNTYYKWRCPNKKWFFDKHDQFDNVYRGEM